MERGYFRIGRWAGVPILVHWATPLGLWAFSGFRFDVVAMAALAFVVVVHELGHAWVVLRVGATPTRVELLPFGGLCHWRGEVTPVQRSYIAWGGILGQLVLLCLTVAIGLLRGPAETAPAREIAYAFTWGSAYMMAFNLLPIPPLDGREAWAIIPRMIRARADWRRIVLRRQKAAVAKRIQSLNALERNADEPPAEVKELVADLLEDVKRGSGTDS